MKKNIAVILFFILIHVSGCEKEISVSPPDTPPPKGKIFITSYPQGFKIYLNEKYRIRKTPDSLLWLESGKYNITLKKDLFFDSSFVVDVTENQKTSLFIDYSLNPSMKGNLLINTRPNGSNIFINDSNTSKVTPSLFEDLLPDIYNVKLVAPGFETKEKRISVESSKTAEVGGAMINTELWSYYNIENSGLYPVELTCLTVDINNNIWIGSRNGAIKFDGYTWKRFLPGDSEMPHQVVNSITADSNGDIWIATNNGMGIANSFTVYRKIVYNDPVRFYSVFFRDSDNDPAVFYLTSSSASKKRIQNPIVTVSKFIPNYGNLSTIWINDNIAYIGSTENGLFVWNVVSEEVINFNTFNSDIRRNNISALYGNEDEVYIGFLPSAARTGGLTKFDGENFSQLVLNENDVVINTIFVDSKNIKWVGATVGIYVFDNIENRQLLNEDVTGLPLQDVTGICEDSFGNIWFATRNNGLYKLKNPSYYYSN